MQIQFTNLEKYPAKEIDVHHLLKKKICKRYGFSPEYYFNKVLLENYFHINMENNPKNHTKDKQELYFSVINHFQSLLAKKGVFLMRNELLTMMKFYEWAICTNGSKLKVGDLDVKFAYSLIIKYSKLFESEQNES